MIVSASLLQLAAAAAAPNLDVSAAASDCPKGQAGAVVVCGSRSGQSPYRIPKTANTYGPKPLRAETNAIPRVHTRAHVESERMPDGNVSKRLMVTFSVPF